MVFAGEILAVFTRGRLLRCGMLQKRRGGGGLRRWSGVGAATQLLRLRLRDLFADVQNVRRRLVDHELVRPGNSSELPAGRACCRAYRFVMLRAQNPHRTSGLSQSG